MSLRDFCQQHETLLPASFRNLIQVTLKSIIVTDASELERRIAEWKPVQGWISRQSKVQVHRDFEGLDDTPGFILAAEFCREGASLHIRQKAHEWVIAEVEEGSGDDALCQPLTFVADKWLMQDDQTGLLYHRYWVLDDDGCPKQLFAAFKGFVPLGKGENQ